MKLLLVLFAVVSAGVFVPHMYADGLTLNLDGTVATAVGTPIANGEEFVFDGLGVGVGAYHDLVSAYNITFDATAVQVAGITTLDVVETCLAAYVGPTPVTCSEASFVYTNDTLGPLLSAVGTLNIGADINGEIAGTDLGLDIGGGQETFTYGPPPSATPEPGSLTLLGTSLLGVAGVLRRKVISA